MWGLGFFQRALMVSGCRQAEQRTVGLMSAWRRGMRRSTHNTEPGFGLLFDVDGVLVRGKSLIPAARRAFQKLLDSAGNFLLPVVFVTNAGNCLPQKKAEQLSHLLDVQICQEQVVLSHNPLRMCTSFHDKCVLVSGQGPVLDIANNSLGFQKAVSIEQLRQHYPLLDMVDHNRRPTPQASPLKTLPKVEAVILFGEPIRWETNLQLVIDVLLTNGKLDSAYEPNHSTQLPVLACNMDLVWMADAPSPRFGHGMFLLCLESVYRKFTGRDLRYEALIGKPNQLTYMYAESVLNQQAASRGWSKPITSIYAVGDNLMTDIYGANLFNCYLAQQHAVRTSSAKLALQGPGCQVTTPPAEEEMTSAWEAPPTAKQCHSVLVCTGVYSPHHPLPSDQISTVKEKLIHSQWDFCFDPTLVEANLVEPHHIAEDVEAAVEFIFQQEGFNQK